MPIGILQDIAHDYKVGNRLLGLDMGSKTIGLAVTDSRLSVATPLQTIQRRKFTKDILILKTVMEDYEIGGLIIGYPLNMDGSAGPRCESIRHFAEELAKYPDIVGENPWMAFWDERLSTVSVEDFLIESVDMSRTKRKQVVDKLAAQHILQGAMDYLKSSGFADKP
jgi:putative Holliday junction resolvase